MTVRNTPAGFDMQFYISVCLARAQIECEHVFYVKFVSFCQIFEQDIPKYYNSKLAFHFHFLVTSICLSNLTVLSPSKDTNIYPRHMIATKNVIFRDLLGVRSPPKSDFSCLAGLSQQQQVGLSLISNNHMPNQFKCTVPFKT